MTRTFLFWVRKGHEWKKNQGETEIEYISELSKRAEDEIINIRWCSKEQIYRYVYYKTEKDWNPWECYKTTTPRKTEYPPKNCRKLWSENHLLLSVTLCLKVPCLHGAYVGSSSPPTLAVLLRSNTALFWVFVVFSLWVPWCCWDSLEGSWQCFPEK